MRFSFKLWNKYEPFEFYYYKSYNNSIGNRGGVFVIGKTSIGFWY